MSNYTRILLVVLLVAVLFTLCLFWLHQKDKLIEDWRAVLTRAWSLRFIILAGLFGGVEMALPLFTDSFPRNIFTAVTVFVCVGGAVSRFWAQPKMKKEDCDAGQPPAKADSGT